MSHLFLFFAYEVNNISEVNMMIITSIITITYCEGINHVVGQWASD